MNIESKKIVIIDDDNTFRHMLGLTLEKEGFVVINCTNGHEALACLKIDTPDLIISDIKMPGIHGIELLHTVKVQYPSIPFVLMTGFNDIIETKEAYELGAKGFLSKPFNHESLCEVLKNILRDQYPPSKVCDEKKYSYLKDPSQFCQIHINEFISGSKISYPIFIKLSDSKMVRVANKGEDLSIQMIERLKSKNIHFLYLLNEDFKKFMCTNTKIVGKLKKYNHIDKQRKSIVINQTLKQVLRFSIEKDIDQETFNLATENMKNSLEYLAIHEKAFTLLERLIKDSENIYAHSCLVSFVGVMIAREMGWTSSEKLSLVALGGLFHDIGKKELPIEVITKSKDELDKNELKLYHSHPEIGQQVIQSLESYPAALDQIILHHHERPDGSGFPHGYGRVKIHPVAKIIGLADDFAGELNQVKIAKNNLVLRVVERLRQKKYLYETEHFNALEKAFAEKLQLNKTT